MAKSAITSKTILANLAVAALVRAWPAFAGFVSDNPEVYVLMSSIVNIGLRMLTKRPVRVRRDKTITVGAVLLSLVLFGCSEMQQKLEPGTFYKRDIGIEVNGKAYEGVVVIPQAAKYSLLLKPKGDLDLILLRTCHREFSGEKLSSGFLGIGKGQFKYEYLPIAGLEDHRVCPMRVDVYESTKGRNSWAFLDFESPDYKLGYLLSCNGFIQAVNGVGVCQTKSGLVQRVDFAEPVRWAPPMPESCAKPVWKNGAYELTTSMGECLYHFDTKDGRIGRLTQIGYDGVLVREAQ